ncbi:vanadium-dependent haloperoxidase [uncultured Cocleimonas sp.]|uniref:vanadium-dependent haloperoxidase n=1 Tax=uncultured Cocleimonas sp. TaxID=1051587 RepID=UPI0026316450|nr:vanadium-dependent haloperoxidase [uncultured Cocleimonas sp.]
MASFNKIKVFISIVFLVLSSYQLRNANAMPYDFDNGNAAVDVVITTIAPTIFQTVSPSGGDATLVLRVTTLVTNSWFDATAPYHPTAVGVYTRLGRRPAAESTTNANMNIALIYASYRVLNSLLPENTQLWRDMLSNVGLDPDDNSQDITTAIGLGNVAGAGVVAGRENDGMNQLGNVDRDYNPMPYMDYTRYKPVNTAYRLSNPSRWQPDLQRQGMGLYKIQQFVTPQFAYVEPYSYSHLPRSFKIARPYASNHRNRHAYRNQADEVLQISANLTDEQKLKAELFDNKIESLGFSAVFAALSQGLTLLEFIHLDFLTNMAAHDAGIFIWSNKRKFDAVRPFSAINYLYKKQPVSAWGGPGKGTVVLPANEWKSYLEEADHPEYPSASACFCAAHTQSARLFLGNDNLGYQVSRTAGSSRIEPGIVPAVDTTLSFDTWTEFNNDCGESRLWAGVHFRAAVDASKEVCNGFGDMANEYVSSLIDGTAPARQVSEGSWRGHKHH